jgi:hypothetical protein
MRRRIAAQTGALVTCVASVAWLAMTVTGQTVGEVRPITTVLELRPGECPFVSTYSQLVGTPGLATPVAAIRQVVPSAIVSDVAQVKDGWVRIKTFEKGRAVAVYDVEEVLAGGWLLAQRGNSEPCPAGVESPA